MNILCVMHLEQMKKEKLSGIRWLILAGTLFLMALVLAPVWTSNFSIVLAWLSLVMVIGAGETILHIHHQKILHRANHQYTEIPLCRR